jgi:hypothetical protein
MEGPVHISLAMESKIALLLKEEKWKEEGIKRVPLVDFVELLMPCILHLENRVGEKNITKIACKGLDYWKGPKKKKMKKLAHIIQTKVLGTEISPAH